MRDIIEAYTTGLRMFFEFISHIMGILTPIIMIVVVVALL